MKKRILVIGLIMFIFGLSHAQEFRAKALFMYNFTRLIEWPGSSDTEFVIGVLGNSPVLSELEQIVKGKKAGERKIVIKKYENLSQINSCEILYISHRLSHQISGALDQLKGSNTLVVGEKRGLVNNGAAINFVMNDNRLSFELEVNNAEKHGLKVSKSLENMAAKRS